MSWGKGDGGGGEMRGGNKGERTRGALIAVCDVRYKASRVRKKGLNGEKVCENSNEKRNETEKMKTNGKN